MKFWIGAALMCLCVVTAKSQDKSADESEFIQDGALEVLGPKAAVAVHDASQLAAAAKQAKFAPGPLAGKFDLDGPPTFGAWQSIKSADQAIGFSKRVYHVDKGAQTLLNVGLFAGAYKPIFSAPGDSPRALGGLVFAVPGSAMDWALGTNMGDAWLPKLKAGILAAYDVTRPKALKAVPDFVGVGVTYPVGG